MSARECCGTPKWNGHSDDCKWTSIQIRGPLPMGTAGALMQLIGSAWPEAMIETSDNYALSMSIPKSQAQTVDQEFIDTIRKSAHEADHEPMNFLGFRDGWVAFAPPEEMCLALGEVAHAIMVRSDLEIVNHLEWTVLTGKEPDDPSYVLSISRSREQTPLAMRKKAEAEVERLQAALNIMQAHELENERLKKLLEKHGIDPEES